MAKKGEKLLALMLVAALVLGGRKRWSDTGGRGL